MDSIKTEKIGNFIIKIYFDNDNDSPRSWGNSSTIISLVPRHFSSDEDAIPLETDEDGKLILDSEGFYNYATGGKALVLPIYMYSHSGDTISTKPFGEPWDSGLVGYIYMNNLTAMAEKIIIPETGSVDWKAVEERLKGEIATFDQYIRGDVYLYNTHAINPFDEHGEIIDSCGDIYGLDEALQMAKDNLPTLDANYEFDLAEAY